MLLLRNGKFEPELFFFSLAKERKNLIAASQVGDADSSRAPGLTSGLQGSMNVHRGALFLVVQ